MRAFAGGDGARSEPDPLGGRPDSSVGRGCARLLLIGQLPGLGPAGSVGWHGAPCHLQCAAGCLAAAVQALSYRNQGGRPVMGPQMLIELLTWSAKLVTEQSGISNKGTGKGRWRRKLYSDLSGSAELLCIVSVL